MILNDDRLSDERKSHSEPFMMIMGETCLLDKQSPQKSEGFVCDLGVVSFNANIKVFFHCFTDKNRLVATLIGIYSTF